MAKALAYWLMLTIAITAQAESSRQLNDTTKPADVVEMSKVVGQPYRILFADGTAIGFKVREIFLPLHTTITLNENSCTPTVGQKGDFIIPLIGYALVPYWILHPTKQGQAVLKYDDEDKTTIVVKSSTSFMTRLNDKNFDARAARMKTSQIRDVKIWRKSQTLKAGFGWYECGKGNCQGLLPKSKQIVFWDENFESDNEQSAMTSSFRQLTFTQMTTRMESIALPKKANALQFGAPKRYYGPAVGIFPPGITYQVQWTFHDKNIIDAGDEYCSMKWDLDFTRIFNAFVQMNAGIDKPEEVRLDRMPVYLFREGDDNILLLSEVFSPDEWTGEKKFIR